MTLEELEAKRPQIEELCHRFQVAKLDVFGSVARGEARPDSDVDFLVSFQPGNRLTLFDYAELRMSLEESIGVSVHLTEEFPFRNPYFAKSVEASRRSFLFE